MENDQPLKEGTTTGFIAAEPKAGDWEIRGESGIESQIENVSADWRRFVPDNQWQKVMTTGFDTFACVSFSAEQVFATYLNYLLSLNIILAPAASDFLVKNGYIVNGKVAFSPRFLAKVSGTTKNGNSMPAVMDAARKFGLVPDSVWPMPKAEIEANPAGAWDIYYASVPQNVLDLGKQFLAHFEPLYEWVAYTGVPMSHSEFSKSLVTAPIQIAAAVCHPWNTSGPIAGCGVGTAHATELLFVQATGAVEILDHYDPFAKELAADYSIAWAMRALLQPLDSKVPQTLYQPPVGFKHLFKDQIDFGATGVEVVALQEALRADGEFPLTVDSTGYFGNVTLLALQKFQAKYGIATSGTPTTTGYGHVGPATMKKLNELFNK